MLDDEARRCGCYLAMYRVLELILGEDSGIYLQISVIMHYGFLLCTHHICDKTIARPSMVDAASLLFTPSLFSSAVSTWPTLLPIRFGRWLSGVSNGWAVAGHAMDEQALGRVTAMKFYGFGKPLLQPLNRFYSEERGSEAYWLLVFLGRKAELDIVSSVG